MSKNKINSAFIFRQKAEEILKSKDSEATNPGFPDHEMLQLMHELEMHQVELEMQNEELLLTISKIGLQNQNLNESLLRANNLRKDDIANGKIAEEKLRKSEKSYKNLIDTISDVIYEIDREGIIKYISPSVYRTLGYRPEEVIGKNIVSYVFEGDRDMITARLKTLCKKDYSYMEYRYVNKGGDICWVRSSTSAILKDGFLMGGTGTLTDITARKRTEEEIMDLTSNLEVKIVERTSELALTNAYLLIEIEERKRVEELLLKSEKSYRSVVENVNEIIFRTDAEGLWQFLNKSWEEMTGFTVEESLGKLFIDYVHPDDRTRNRELFEPLISRKTEYCRHEVRYLTKSGGFRWIEVFARLDVNEHNEITGTFGTLQDITERKEIEAGLEKTSTDLAAIKIIADQVSEFAEDIINTVREPLLVLDKDLRVVKASRSFYDFFKVTSAETIGVRIYELGNHQWDIPKLRELLETILPEQVTFDNYEVEHDFSTIGKRNMLLNARNIQQGLGKEQIILLAIEDITERKEIEAGLEKTRTDLAAIKIIADQVSEFAEDIINTVREPLLVLDKDLRVVKASRSFYDFFKVTSAETIGVRIYELGNHQWDIPKLRELLETILPEQVTFDNYEVEHDFSTIGKRNMLLNARNIQQGLGKEQIILLAIEDITERKHTENLLEQTRINYETFFNTIDDLLWVLDENGNIIHTNNAVNTRLEFTVDELYKQSVLLAHPPGRREEVWRIVGEILSGTSEFCGVPVETKSGKQIPVETKVKPGFWNGEPVIFGVSKDVSKINLSEEKFSKAFRSNSALMAISGYENGLFMDVNDSFLKTLGYLRDEIIGMPSHEIHLFVNPESRNEIIEKLNLNISFREKEIEVKTKSGAILVGLFSADSIYINDQQCLLTVMIDITDRKLAEEELEKARIEAENANLAKSEFLSRMSHELRTPMNSILGFAQLMEMSEISPAHRKGVNHILKSGKHLLDLINEVLDISRIEAGMISLSIEPVKLHNVILEMLDIVQSQALHRNQKIELIPSPSDQLFVLADNQRLKQVLLNLFSNALKYNHESGSVQVKTELRQSGSAAKPMIRISVIDTGLGIKPEEIDKIFLPFERIGAEKTKTEGTGLGLNVVKKLIEVMDGKVGVNSIPGVGSTFWIELEQAKYREFIDVSAILEPKQEMAEDLKSGTILYFEDNNSNIELVDEILGIHRPNVHLFTSISGKNAVELAKDIKPDLILLDLDLPDIHGREVFINLQADSGTKSIPVVIISADAMTHQIRKMLKAGAQDYLTKPIEIALFLKMVDKWIEKAENHSSVNNN